MNLSLNYINEKCKPEGIASGLFLKALDIHAYENYKAQIIKSKDLLGVTTHIMKDSLEGQGTVMEVDKVFYLDTLYRCIIDTGIEIPDLTKFNMELQPITGLILRKGIYISPKVYPIAKEDKKYIGVIAINFATYRFPIKQFDVIATLKVTIKDQIVICHPEPKSEQPSN